MSGRTMFTRCARASQSVRITSSLARRNVSVAALASNTAASQAFVPAATGFRKAAPVTHTTCRSRTYSTESSSSSGDRPHQISARGTKLWNYEQMAQLAKNPGEVIIIDTRESAEIESTGKIPGAVNVPIASQPEGFFLQPQDFRDRFGFTRPEKSSELVFYCKAGVRSKAAAKLAQEAGWTNVGEYPGSWLDWAANGGETEAGDRS